MRNRRVLVAGVLGLALLAVACSGGGSPRPATGSGLLLPATADALPTFDPAKFQQLLAELKGTPVVVNIWASWCGPCISEAPHLASLARETKGKVQFLGVDIIDKRPSARAFIHRYGWIYPSVFDPTGSIRDGLGYLGQPVTLVFDRSGHQVFVYSGPVTDDVLRTELHTLGVV
jgi:cytochrome c biogenesis protein CcmG, thiol:disulfide interchange protein DsbE